MVKKVKLTPKREDPTDNVDTGLYRRTCLACETGFEGSARATRCTTCRTEGRTTKPKASQAQLKTATNTAEAKRCYDKTCRACGTDFSTHKARAARCNDCITADRKVRTRPCLNCQKRFTLLDEAQLNCAPCAELLDIAPHQMTAEQEATALENAHLSEHLLRLENQRVWMSQRQLKPKGYTKMSPRTIKTTIGILWLNLCAADGAAASVMYAAEPRNLTEDDKVRLLTAFFRLRAKGYHPSAIAKLCPKALLKQTTQQALDDLPKLDEPEPTETAANPSMNDWGRIASKVALGLHTPTLTER